MSNPLYRISYASWGSFHEDDMDEVIDFDYNGDKLIDATELVAAVKDIVNREGGNLYTIYINMGS